jgi:hypothetical protein
MWCVRTVQRPRRRLDHHPTLFYSFICFQDRGYIFLSLSGVQPTKVWTRLGTYKYQQWPPWHTTAYQGDSALTGLQQACQGGSITSMLHEAWGSEGMNTFHKALKSLSDRAVLEPTSYW